MISERLRHDCAWALAHNILETVAPCLREEEYRDAFATFYEAAKAMLISYDIMLERQAQRVKPSKN